MSGTPPKISWSPIPIHVDLCISYREKKSKKVYTCEMAYLNVIMDQKLEHLKPNIYNRIDHKITRLDLEWNIKKGRYRYSAWTTRKLVSYDLTSL